MKFYESKETAPLAFYKFFRNICLPLGVASMIFSFYRMITKNNNGWEEIVNIVMYAVNILLSVFLFIGLAKWKRYTIALLIVQLVFSIAGTIKGLILHNVLAYVIAGVIVLPIDVLVFIYFYKRKKLLDGVPYKIPADYTTYDMNLKHYYTPDTPHCKCGALRQKGKKYCPECGRKYSNRS